MAQYLLKRSLLAFLVLTCAGLIIFAILCVLPGDFFTPAKIGIALAGLPVEETHKALLKEYGLDQPWIIQFFRWYGKALFQGDLGYSLYFKGPLKEHFFAMGGPITNTLLVSGLSMAMAWLAAIPLGLLTAFRRGRFMHLLIHAVGMPMVAIPGFYFAGLFLAVFWWLGGDPILARPSMWGLCGYMYNGCPMSWAKLFSCVIHMLPVWIIVGIPVFMVALKTFRGSIIDTLGMKYITTARAKGLSEMRVYFGHAVRNGLNPLISTIGLTLPNVLISAYVTGFMFGIPTYGTLVFRALGYQDPALLAATMLFYSVVLVVGNFLADVLLAVVDPRIRYD